MTAWLGTAAAVLLVACSAPRDAAPTRIETPHPTDSVRELPPEGTALEPGTYTFSGFTPRVTFEVGSGFEAAHQLGEFFDITTAADGAMLGFARPTHIVRGPSERSPTRNMSTWEALDQLTRSRSLARVQRVDVRVGDREAPGIEAIGARGNLFAGPEGAFTVTTGARYRITPVATADALVLVVQQVVEKPYEQQFVETAEVLRTVTFGD